MFYYSLCYSDVMFNIYIYIHKYTYIKQYLYHIEYIIFNKNFCHLYFLPYSPPLQPQNKKIRQFAAMKEIWTTSEQTRHWRNWNSKIIF